MRAYFEVPGACVPCPRVRTARGKRAYYPQRYTAWLKSAQVEALSQCGRLLWDGPVRVIVYFYGARKNADIDNLLKSVLDSMQGILILDDKQVQDADVRKRDGDKRTCVTVYEELRDV